MKNPTLFDALKHTALGDTAQPTLRQTFIMTSRNGLHARPCAVLIRTLQPFACEVKIECGEATANGNSILGVMSLAAVQQLFETKFQKAYAPENKGSSGMVGTAQTGNPSTKNEPRLTL